MKKRLITSSLLVFVLSSCNFGKIDETNKETGYEVFKDLTIENGINIKGTNSADPSTKSIIYPFGKVDGAKTIWTLAEWGSKKDLVDATPNNTKDGITYSETGKNISFKKENNTIEVTMEVIASDEYDAPRKDGEDWPHLLMEQKIDTNNKIENAGEMNFTLDVKLLRNEIKMEDFEFDPNMHTAQFSIYFSVGNINPESESYGDYFWFGLPVYDYRYPDGIEEYSAQDLGKEDATNKFIYKPASKEVFKGNVNNKEWIKINLDILPYIKKAIQTAKGRGYLKGSNTPDLAIGSSNIGWEVQGTFDCSIKYKNLSLTYIPKE